MSTPDFRVDLARGNAGEAFLVAQHGLDYPIANERRWDLERDDDAKPGIETIEVKCDSHDPATTPNFFMERYTRVAGQPGAVKGGPWRAAEHGVDTFVYLYYRPDGLFTPVAYWFEDVPSLVAHLDANGTEYETRLVRGYGCGRTLTAVGWLVPRSGLRHLARKVIYQ